MIGKQKVTQQFSLPNQAIALKYFELFLIALL